jgi:hypothetical protein
VTGQDQHPISGLSKASEDEDALKTGQDGEDGKVQERSQRWKIA